MKKTIILSVFILLICTIVSFARSDIKLMVKGTLIECDVPPVIVNARTIVPIRAVLEPLGAKMQWNDAEKKVIIIMEETKIELVVNSKIAIVNGNAVTLDTPPVLINDRTMIPVRFVAQTFNYDVSWNESEQMVVISSKAPITEKNKILYVKYNRTQQNLNLTVNFENPLSDYKIYPMDSPKRLVIELSNCAYDNTREFSINYGGISLIRMANHDDYFKLVIDEDDYLPYEMILSDDKKTATIVFNLRHDIVKPDPGGVTVVIDAGHGGSDSGATFQEVKEKEINIDVANRVAQILRDNGINVVQTRNSDVTMPLSGRYGLANDENATLFVSIHSNSYDDLSANGTETWYSELKDNNYPDKMPSKNIAGAIQKELIAALGTNDRGIKNEDEYVVLKNTTMPAVLIELGFITNDYDRGVLMDVSKRAAAAEAIARVILAQF